MMIIVKAKKLCTDMGITKESLKLSNGWLSRFKRRHGICLRLLHGEAGSVDTSQLEAHRRELSEVIDDYEPCDVYNLDEGYFFACSQASSHWELGV